MFQNEGKEPTMIS